MVDQQGDMESCAYWFAALQGCKFPDRAAAEMQ